MKYTETKVCPVCKRPFSNRKRWAARGMWESIVYCSDKCRKQAKSAQKARGN